MIEISFLTGLICGILIGCFLCLVIKKSTFNNEKKELLDEKKDQCDYWKPEGWRPDNP